MFHTILAIIALICAYAGVALFRQWAIHRMLDIPNARSSHSQPTPRGGGVVIVGVTLIGIVIAGLLEPHTDWLPLTAYIAGALLIAVVSWMDDVQTLPSSVRFGTHTVGALLAIGGYGFWQSVNIPLVGSIPLFWLGIPITFLWVAGLTNAYNFMDGIDGIAGGQAVVAGLGWAMIGWLSQQPIIIALGMLIAASSLGFLGHNWHPARIFMGDVGSAFLGYSFAVLPLMLNRPAIPLVGFLVVWPFILDTVFTFLRRLSKGENVFAAHRSHGYQRMVIAGYRHNSVALLYMGLALIGVILAVVWYARVVR